MHYTEKQLNAKHFWAPRPPLFFKCVLKKKSKQDAIKSVLYQLELVGFSPEDAEKVQVSMSETEVRVAYFIKVGEEGKKLIVQYCLLPHDADTDGGHTCSLNKMRSKLTISLPQRRVGN